MNPAISASIVTYCNSPSDILRAAQSFIKDTDDKAMLYIIDHSPTDDLHRHLGGMQNVRYAHHPENKGYGAGHNIAIRQILSTHDYHFVINPDVHFEQGTLPTIIEFMQQHPSVGLVMPKVINPQGEVQHLAKLIPTPMDLLFKRFLPQSWTKERLHRFTLQDKDYNKCFEAPYLSGCFMSLNVKALKDVGLFDERFFLYPEDIDLSRRIHEQYKTVYLPKATITHVHEAGSYKSLRMLGIHMVNMIRYFNKWGWIFDHKRKAANARVLKDLKYFHP